MSWTFSISHELNNSWPIETQPNKFHPEKKGIKLLTEIKVKKRNIFVSYPGQLFP
jgi:hypothetical protein